MKMLLSSRKMKASDDQRLSHHQVDISGRYQRGRNSVYRERPAALTFAPRSRFGRARWCAGACAPARALAPCRPSLDRSFSPSPPRHEDFRHPVHRRRELVALNRAGGIDMLGADLGAFADEGTAPDAHVLRQDLVALASALVARIEVVTLRQC